MSVEGQALFWALEMQKGMGSSSCSQAEYPHPHGMGWGTGKFSLGETEDPGGSRACFAEIQLHCRHRGSFEVGSPEKAAATSAPTTRMRGSSRRCPLLTLPPGFKNAQ